MRVQTLVLMMVIGKSVSTVQHHRESLSFAVTVTHTATVGCTVLSASHACPRPVADTAQLHWRLLKEMTLRLGFNRNSALKDKIRLDCGFRARRLQKSFAPMLKDKHSRSPWLAVDVFSIIR
jgi:hypothetical protein